ncbi:hypothetical protein MRX96_023556 [Rhipicephalus microplus]
MGGGSSFHGLPADEHLFAPGNFRQPGDSNRRDVDGGRKEEERSPKQSDADSRSESLTGLAFVIALSLQKRAMLTGRGLRDRHTKTASDSSFLVAWIQETVMDLTKTSEIVDPCLNAAGFGVCIEARAFLTHPPSVRRLAGVRRLWREPLSAR